MYAVLTLSGINITMLVNFFFFDTATAVCVAAVCVCLCVCVCVCVCVAAVYVAAQQGFGKVALNCGSGGGTSCRQQSFTLFTQKTLI